MSLIHPNNKETTTTLTNVNEKDVQPNAIDVKVAKVFQILPRAFQLGEHKKTVRGTSELQPDKDGVWSLQPGAYEVVMENIVNVGAGEAGWVITRSTLNRNGVFLTSGLYDSGYHGEICAVMHVTTGVFQLQKGTRVGQYITCKAETVGMYDGSYGYAADGKPKEEQKKYGTTTDLANEDLLPPLKVKK